MHDFKLLDGLSNYMSRHAHGDKSATIAIPLTWPNLKNAEYEVVMRLCRAAENIGSRIIVTDNDGYPLWASDKADVDKNNRITQRDVDFCISLHFESPKLVDIYTYYTVWQPVEFYEKFGYEKSISKVLTFDDALSCGSNECDAHIRNLLFDARGQTIEKIPYLFHSPPEPYLTPRIDEHSSLFYVGINWEKVSDKKGRFHELLEMLDESEIVDIYGPRQLFNVSPWEGYQTYRGEIPFDGKSVVEAVNKSGICLALSSKPHQQSGIMSNRLFEGLAGGAVIVANSNSFIDKYFKDLVYVLEDSDDDNELYFQLQGIVDQIRRDPDSANARALKGQERLRELFSPENCFRSLIQQHGERKSNFDYSVISKSKIRLILKYDGSSPAVVQAKIDELKLQTGVAISLTVIANSFVLKTLSKETEGAVKKLDFHEISKVDGCSRPMYGETTLSAISNLGDSPFAFVSVHEQYFTTHFGSLAKRLESRPKSLAAVSEVIVESTDASGERSSRTLRAHTSSFGDHHDHQMPELGTHLFSSQLTEHISDSLISLLHGTEVTYLAALAERTGEIQKSGRATCILSPVQSEIVENDSIPIELQYAFIQDALRYFPERQTGIRSRLRTDHALENSSPIPFEDCDTRLPLGVVVGVSEGGRGESMIGRGFSHPEQTATWIDGTDAQLQFTLIGSVPDEDNGNMELVLRMAGRRSSINGQDQECFISINGTRLKYTSLPENEIEIVVQLPASTRRNSSFLVEFQLRHAEQVLDESGTVVDPRRLSARVHSVCMRLRQEIAIDDISVGETYPLGRINTDRMLARNGILLHDEKIELTDETAVFRMNLTNVTSNMNLRLGVSSEFRSSSAFAEVMCSLNDVSVGTKKISPNTEEINFPLLKVVADEQAKCKLEINRSIVQSGLEKDPGVFRDPDKIFIETISFELIEEVCLDHKYRLSTAADRPNFIIHGFSHSEEEFTWIEGRQAELMFQFPAQSKGRTWFKIVGRAWPSRSSKIQYLIVNVNGRRIAHFELKENLDSYSCAIPTELLSSEIVTLTLALSYAEQVLDNDGNVLDSRYLSMCVESVMFCSEDPSTLN